MSEENTMNPDAREEFETITNRPVLCTICDQDVRVIDFWPHWRSVHPDATLAQRLRQRVHDGRAEYHEHCCSWLIWAGQDDGDPNRPFAEMPPCDCDGDEIVAAALTALTEAEVS